MALILAAFIVFGILLSSELWWRFKRPKSEFSRKFIHITVGTFVAFWPFFLSWNEIRLLCLGFVVVVSVSKWFHVFRSVHSVQRPTWGEVFFALVVGLMTFVTNSKAVYATALLQMALADGLAAIVGVRFGKANRYHVFGHEKSLIGTLTFMLAAEAILVGYSLHSHHLGPGYIAGLVAVSALVENVAVLGLDNLLVPLVVALVLEHLR